MAVYSVITKTNQPLLEQAVSTHFPAHSYKLTGNVFFVASNLPAREVAIKLGIKHRDSDSNVMGSYDGVVSALSPSYFGWEATDLWEWLQRSHQGEGL